MKLCKLKAIYNISMVLSIAITCVVIPSSMSTICLAQDNKYDTVTDYTTIVPATIDGEINRHWIQDINKKWRYVDEFEVSAYGLFYDKYGDIYYGNDDGYILQNDTDKEGQYFGSDGRLVNLGASMIYNKEAEGLAGKITKGEVVLLDKNINTIEFLEYYIGQKYMLKQPAVLETKIIRDNNISKMRLKLQNGLIHDELIIKQEIDKLYKNENIIGTDKEKILKLANLLRTNTTYDEAYTNKDMMQALKDKRGCCWHYARMMNYMLNENGIYSEIIDGKFVNASHSWLRAKVNNNWQYIDISSFIESNNESLIDLNYNYYIANYRNRGRVIPYK